MKSKRVLSIRHRFDSQKVSKVTLNPRIVYTGDGAIDS
jgi:hypothetical protein